MYYLTGPAKYAQLKLRSSLIKRKKGRVETGNSSQFLCHVARDMCFGSEFEVVNVFLVCQFLSPLVLYVLSVGCLLYPWISSLAKSKDGS